jgi:hypothetical protein
MIKVFIDLIRHVFELDKQASTIMQKPDNHLDADMAMIRIQALEWVQGTIQDILF